MIWHPIIKRKQLIEDAINRGRNKLRKKGKEEETLWRFHERNWSCVREALIGLSSSPFLSLSAPIAFSFPTTQLEGPQRCVILIKIIRVELR